MPFESSFHTDVVTAKTKEDKISCLDTIEVQGISSQAKAFLEDLRKEIQETTHIDKQRYIQLLQKHGFESKIAEVELIFTVIDTPTEELLKSGEFQKITTSKNSALILFVIKRIKGDISPEISSPAIEQLLAQLGSLPDRELSKNLLFQRGIVDFGKGGSGATPQDNRWKESFFLNFPSPQNSHIIEEIHFDEKSPFFQAINPNMRREFRDFLKANSLLGIKLKISQFDVKRIIKSVNSVSPFLGSPKAMTYEIRKKIISIIQRVKESKVVKIGNSEVLIHPTQKVQIIKRGEYKYLVLQTIRNFHNTGPDICIPGEENRTPGVTREEIPLEEGYTITSNIEKGATVVLQNGVSLPLLPEIFPGLTQKEKFALDYPLVHIVVEHFLMKTQYLKENPGLSEVGMIDDIEDRISRVQDFIYKFAFSLDPSNVEQSTEMLDALLKIMVSGKWANPDAGKNFLSGVQLRYFSNFQNNGKYRDDGFSRKALFDTLLNTAGESQEISETKTFWLIKGRYSDKTNTTLNVQNAVADKLIAHSFPVIREILSGNENFDTLLETNSKQGIQEYLIGWLLKMNIPKEEAGEIAGKVTKEVIEALDKFEKKQSKSPLLKDAKRGVISSINEQKSLVGQPPLTAEEERIIGNEIHLLVKKQTFASIVKHGILRNLVERMENRGGENSYTGLYAGIVGLHSGEKDYLKDLLTPSDENMAILVDISICIVTSFIASEALIYKGAQGLMFLAQIAKQGGAAQKIILGALSSSKIKKIAPIFAYTGPGVAISGLQERSFGNISSKTLNPKEYARVASVYAGVNLLAILLSRGLAKVSPQAFLGNPQVVELMVNLAGNTVGGAKVAVWGLDIEYLQGETPQTAEDWFKVLVVVAEMKKLDPDAKVQVKRNPNGDWEGK